MNLMDPAFKNRYLKYKMKVKQWERSFMEKYERNPNKNDFKKADKPIREAYQMYYELKTQYLDQSLTDISFNVESENSTTSDSYLEEFQNENNKNMSIVENIDSEVSINNTINSSSEEIFKSNDNETNISLIDCKSNDTLELSNLNDSGVTDEIKNVKGVWNSSLSLKNKKSVKGNNKNGLNKSLFQLSQTKFKSLSLPKRNPKKNISFSKNKSFSKNNDDSENKLSESINKTDNEIDNELNNKNENLIVDENTLDFMDRNFTDSFKIISELKKSSQSLNIMNHVNEKCSIKYDGKLNEGWVNRCIDNINEVKKIKINMPPSVQTPPEEKITVTSEKDNDNNTKNFSVQTPSEEKISVTSEKDNENNTKNATISDDEDYILNSDSEEERKNKRIRNSRLFSNLDIQIIKKPCLAINDSDEDFILSIDDESKLKEIENNFINKNENQVIEQESLEISAIDALVNSQDCTLAPLVKKKGRKRKVQTTDTKKSKDNATELAAPKKRGRKTKAKAEDKSSDVPDTDESEDEDKKPVTKKSNTKAKKKPAKKANENFLKLNMKKKTYTRGFKSFNASKYKRVQWTQRKRESYKCFKCGKTGHFIKECKDFENEDSLLPKNDNEEYQSSNLTIHEVEKLNI